jgi:hypothetical protein
MKSRRAFVVLWALVILIFPSANVSHANLMNRDFSAGLNSWKFEGDVQSINEEAVLGDEGATWSLLYQPIALNPSKYTLEFDFANLLSSEPDDSSPYFAFFDTFYASLFFVNEISQFDLYSSDYDDSIALFDMDISGVFNNNGTVGPSSKGQDWLHFSIAFENNYNYVIPTFELLDFNFIDNDSEVILDNVDINPVPEPATLLLFGSGLAALTGLARKKRKISSHEAF